MRKKTLILLATLLQTSSITSTSVEQAYLNLAQALRGEGTIGEAITQYHLVLKRNPNNSQALLELGQLVLQQGNIDEAISYFSKRLILNPSCVQTECCLGDAYSKKKNFSQAFDHYRAALALNPKNIALYNKFASTLSTAGDHEAAKTIYKKALAIEPEHSGILTKLALACIEQQHYQEALEYFEKIPLTDKSTDHDILLQKAKIYLLLDQYEPAYHIYKKLLEEHPENIALRTKLAQILRKMGKIDAALDHYHALLKLKPDSSSLHFELAKGYLILNQLEQGFYFLDQANKTINHAYFQGKKLRSLDKLSGKIIYITGEWFYEDMLQFIRYVKILKELGATTIAQCPEKLLPVIAPCNFIDKIFSIESNQICNFDYYIPLSSLPALLSTSTTTIPTPIPYITPEQHATTFWHTTFSTDKQIKVGIFIDEKRHPRLQPAVLISQLANHATSIYWLSPNSTQQIAKNCPPTTLVHICGKGFDVSKEHLIQVTACMHELDLIITTDGTYAHLAGALGKPTLVFVHPDEQWRWTHDHSHSLWYPTITLVLPEEQEKPEAVQATLEKFLLTTTKNC